MKKKYSGLTAIKIPVDYSGRGILTASTTCRPVYTTHFDYNNDFVCDGAEYQDGSPEAPANTQRWNNCMEVGFEAFLP